MSRTSVAQPSSPAGVSGAVCSACGAFMHRKLGAGWGTQGCAKQDFEREVSARRADLHSLDVAGRSRMNPLVLESARSSRARHGCEASVRTGARSAVVDAR
jgi:hypothetical protein